MKTARKIFAFVLCLVMLTTSMFSQGVLSLFETLRASAIAGTEQSYKDARVELDFNKDWKFTLGDDSASYLKGFDDSAWKNVDLPHDFSISQGFSETGTEAESGNIPGGTGWYRKWFNLYEYYTGDRIFLNFDGAYQHTYVYVNGQYVGENHYGYNSFSFEISDYLICSNSSLNLIAVKVVNDLPSSRWYSGSGINRDVSLTIAGPVHVSLYGPQVTTPDIASGDGTAKTTVTMHNDTAISRKVTVEATILDDEYNAVSDTVTSSLITVPAGTEKSVVLEPEVESPELWTLENPNLYTLKTVIKNEDGELIDEYHTTFGYRSINWDADKGFCFNGEYIKLKGVCLHHDQGALGANQEYEAIYRQISILKDMGCNAIRTSHNPASRVVIDICNELGMFVMEEFFDGWDAPKNGNIHDFSEYFNETLKSQNTLIGANGQKWFEFVVEQAMLRDKHDPCVIAWDVGNEIADISGGSTDNYESIVQSIVAIANRLDPSRVLLQGNNRPYQAVNTMIDGYMDVIGGNYNPYTWAQVMTDPNDPRSSKPFVLTEAASVTNSRGVYDTMTYYNYQGTSYDTQAVDWGNKAAQSWYYVAVNDWFSGEFVWTGFDYIGEPTPWNETVNLNTNAVPNSSYFGIVDTAGFAKDSYYLYRSLWNDNSTTLHLVPGSWNRDSLLLNNGYVNVAVYSNAKKIELLLNGSVIATATSTVTTTAAGYKYRTWTESISDSSKCSIGSFYTAEGADFYPQFSVKYAEGTLSVKAYDENGAEITDAVGSAKSVSGTATQIAVNTWQDKDTYVADGTDYIYVEFEARDDDGNFMNDYNGTIEFKVDDKSSRYAEIIGVDNGNAATTDKFQQSSVLKSESETEIQMFNGRALVILRTTEEEGTINFTANTAEFSIEGITVTSESETGIELTDEFEEVITQNNDEYEPTLYDEYEMVKHHINELEPPVDDGSGDDSGDSGDSDDGDDSGEVVVSDKFDVCLSGTTPVLPTGDYAIVNGYYAMGGTSYGYIGFGYQYISSDVEYAPTGSAHMFESFNTEANVVFTFTRLADGTYTIKNKQTGNYLYMESSGSMSYFNPGTPQSFNITANSDGSFSIGTGGCYLGKQTTSYFNGMTTADSKTVLWIYTAPGTPISGSTTPSEPSTPVSDEYIHYTASSTNNNNPVADGDYVIVNIQGGESLLVSGTAANATNGAAGIANVNVSSTMASDYSKLTTSEENIYTFTAQGNGKYYVQHKASQKYISIDRNNSVTLSSTPVALNVKAKDNGDIRIYNDSNVFLDLFKDVGKVFSAWASSFTTANANEDFRLYSAPAAENGGDTGDSGDSDDSTSSDKFEIYLADSTATEGCLENGDYAIFNQGVVMTDKTYYGYAISVDSNLTDKTASPAGSAYTYQEFNTSAANVFTFTHVRDNVYHIKNKSTGLYLHKGDYLDWGLDTIYYSTVPQDICVDANSDGSILLSVDSNYVVRYSTADHFYGSVANEGINPATNANFRMWAYKAPNKSGSGTYSSKQALYDILNEGIEYDYSAYTRASYENLFDALEAGVAVYKKSDATKAELDAATAAIRAAIEALGLDIKKIDGTLFKYGYSNLNGTPNYSDGGLLINAVAVEQMKTAILADIDLVDQIKEIIGYNDSSLGWTDGRADEVLEEVAEAYARIYTIQFTGNPYNGSSISNAASNYQQLEAYSTVPVSLWNLWTKNNTHGADDPVIGGAEIHDGASVQGLASATLNKGVVTSHAAYDLPLSYANDGPNPEHDIVNYTYGFSTGTSYQTVTLEYLTGISVYFPDLFTRESLDANGNVTDATSGQYAKYYWDTEFPMFISTDEYGVNTYHYDSKDTRYLIQASFDDENHTAEMELNEVGNWTISGPNNKTKSGFFPFNYKQGTTNHTGENAIYHYGFTFEHEFYIPKGGKHVNGEDVIFSFSGDDDVLVYVDGVLVLDNGGLHGARAATINFTNCTINYQYAMDVADGILKGNEFQTTYSYNTYIENPDSVNYNADTIAAINKLHEVITDGEVHTLNFFYLERGASDSNCKISFNLSETSEEVKIIDQNLTIDYGLTVEYNITENNNISQAALDNDVKIEYLGICGINEEYTPTYTFEKPELLITFEDDVTYTIEDMEYGICTIDNKGNTTYTPTSTNMAKSENYYVVAKITGDPTYADDVVYYQVEKTSFIPATAIYYEDTFDTITYTNGKVPSNYDNTETKYGLWQTDGKQQTTLKQTADLTDSEANPYGYEQNYSSFATYSGGSIHYTDVSTKNNPSQKYSGGPGAAWPTVSFTFTGTGFDLISITDCTTGAFSVIVKDKNNNTVRSTVVDTFYGYDYGRLYADDEGNFTLDDTKIPLYRTERGTCTSEVMYYDENGAVTKVPHYYDENDNVVETETSNPAYSYAYGWVVASPDSTETLYQIPVIKITDLAYGNYSVTITPTFTSSFGHSSKDENGNPYYRVYLDAIKIYSPAGVDDEIADEDVKKAYSTDDELYPSYLEVKDMLIGADSLSETDTQGIIFIDGIAALDNDIATYKTAGPNNELYLAKDQAVAFEIWATSVPTDVQIGVKLACGNPDFTVSYASKTTDLDIKTATDTYYSFNTILPNDGKLTWRQVTGSDGNKYYTTGTVVIQNTGEQGSVLSVTNMKWTFSQVGGKGYFRIPTPIVDENVTFVATTETQATAYSLMRMRTANLDVEQVEEPEIVKDEQGNTVVTVKFRTSSDVDSLVVTDENGEVVSSDKYEAVASPVEGEDAAEWTVTFTENKGGDYTYQIAGAYSNGYTDDEKAVTISFTVETPPVEEPDIDPDDPTVDPDDPTVDPDNPDINPDEDPDVNPDENPEDNPTDEPNDEPDDSGNDESDYDIFDVIVWAFKEVVKIIKFVIGLLGIKF